MSDSQKLDKQAEKEARKRQKKLQNSARDLRRRMIKFSQDARFALALAAALPLYWDGFYSIENADEMDPNESLRFFDWFLFDYRHDGQPRLVEQFAEENRDELNEWELEVLEGWLDTPAPGAYEYIDFDAFSNRFRLRDFFTDDEVTAVSAAGSGYAKKGDLILTRIVPVGDEMVFSTVGAYLPQDEIGDLAAKIEAARAADAENHPDASQNEFMRRHSHLIIHHALAQSVDQGRFAVSRLDPTRVDKAVQRAGKKAVKKIRRRK